MNAPVSPHLGQFNNRHIDSWYAASTENPPGYPPCGSARHDTDVCVIGGGFAGLSCALELAERGSSVILLEGGLIGYGASGRNGGQLLHGFACSTDKIARQLGADAARLCWDLSRQALKLLTQRVVRHHIDCDLHWGYLTAASTLKQCRQLKNMQRGLDQYDYHQTRWFEHGELGEQIDSPAYIGGLFDAGCGHLHPLRYAQGLARAAHQAGVQLFERTRATQIENQGEQVEIRTADGGTIRAARLVLACNVDIGALDLKLAHQFLPVASHIVATEPLSVELTSRLLPTNAAVCDSNHVLNYFRLSHDHRMLFGGRLKYPTTDPDAIAAQRQAELGRIFPDLAQSRIDYSWGGYIDIGLNKAPQFGRKNPQIYYAQGFAGHGVALTGLAGQLIAQAIHQESLGFDLFARLKPPKIPLHALTSQPLVHCAIAFYRMCDRLGV